MAELHVELVSVEREVWSGEADLIVARTTEGELGILPGHAPLLAELAEGFTVSIRRGGNDVIAAVHGGFLSVTERGVTILAEVAELSDELDASRASDDLARARSEGDERGARRAEGRLRAVGQPV